MSGRDEKSKGVLKKRKLLLDCPEVKCIACNKWFNSLIEYGRHICQAIKQDWGRS